MNILAIETATPMCSVALQAGDQILERAELSPRGHANLLLPWIAELLAEAGITYRDLDRIAVGRGPGGFTSLRIGLSVAQGIALAHDLRVSPVSSLAALALAADPHSGHERILALIDARMGEIFAGWFIRVDGRLRADGPERVLPPQELRLPDAAPWMVAGSGLAAFPELIRQALGAGMRVACPEVWPGARQALKLGLVTEPVDSWEVEPVYVRNDVTS